MEQFREHEALADVLRPDNKKALRQQESLFVETILPVLNVSLRNCQ